MARSLEGLRVLDVTHVMAGSYCGMLLADMGADVVKVEKPGHGDDLRLWGSHLTHGESPAFMAINRNKRGIVIDLNSEEGSATLRRMAKQADVLVENFRPGTLERLGLGHEALSEENPSLIYCSISGFGSTGPYRDHGGYDLIAQGMSGLMSFNGDPEGSPAKVGAPICDLNAGMFAAYGVLSRPTHKVRDTWLSHGWRENPAEAGC